MKTINYNDYNNQLSKVFGKNEQGHPIRMIGTHRGITELKHEEEKRLRSEESYRLLLENAHDCIFIVQDGFIRYANPKTLEVSGFSSEELAGISFFNLVHPDDRSLVMTYNLNCLSGDKVPNYYTFRIKNKSGEDLFLEINVVRIEWNQRPAVICFSIEI